MRLGTITLPTTRGAQLTDLLDPQTEQRTDLASERWEVQTTTPVLINGPAGEELLLVSHAEPDFGDGPLQTGDPQELLFQMFNRARREMDLTTSLHSAILFWEGEPAAGYIDGRQLENENASQALRSLLASFIERSSGIARMAQRALVEEQVEQFPIPIFGSPPSAWKPVARIVGGGTCALYVANAEWSVNPILVGVGGGVAFTIWFFKPSIKVVLRSWTEKVGRVLRTEVKPEDYE